LNLTNDVIVKSDGAIYFSDPRGNALAEQWELAYSDVFRVSPDLGTISLLVNDFVFPNGLAFSPDESVLYIDDFLRRHIRAFNVTPNGMLVKETDRIFADLSGPEPGAPDGMKVDTAGNVYCGGAGGFIFSIPRERSSAVLFTASPRRPVCLRRR
jgi:gluconolactonase